MTTITDLRDPRLWKPCAAAVANQGWLAARRLLELSDRVCGFFAADLDPSPVAPRERS